MFKAKVIEDEKYYDLKHKILLYFLILSLPIGVISNFYSMSTKNILIGLVLYIATLIIIIKYNAKQKQLLNKQELEIDANHIFVNNVIDSTKRQISISDVDRIKVNFEYGKIKDDLESYKNEIQGRFVKHFLEVKINNETERFNFMIDSYYMAEQFRKIVDRWLQEKIPVSIQGSNQ